MRINEKHHKKLTVILIIINLILIGCASFFVYQRFFTTNHFIDNFISGQDYKYSKTLSRYNRVLKQRNNLLKNNISRDELFVWDVQFADLAAEIIEIRQKYIDRINHFITDEYRKIAGNKDEITIYQ